MSIKKAVVKTTTQAVDAALEKFVASAPDAPKSDPETPVRAMRVGAPKTLPKKAPNETVQIALKLTQADLDKIDAAAAEQRTTRASFIRMAVFKVIA